MQIAIALPYAVSIRDFLHSGSLKELAQSGQYQLTIYTLNPDLPEFDQVRQLGVAVKLFEGYQDSRTEHLVKSVYPLFFSDKFEYVRQMLTERPWRRRASAALVALRRLLGTRRCLRAWAGALLWLHRRRHLPRQLDERFGLLIGTRSLINSLDYGLIAEATERGIPVLTVAGSWDNFTTKGFFPFPTRKTVVWNRKMHAELADLFHAEPDRIAIAGYPRAEILRRHTSPTPAGDYLASIGISGYRRFVLYSASYGELTRTSRFPVPLEYVAIRTVCQELVPTLPQDTCVLIRLHPFSKEQDQACFDGLDRCHIFVPGRQDKFVERVMNESDERHLAQQIGLSAGVVSMASTVSIDTLCLERPILNIAFDPVADLSPNDSIVRFYAFNHFADLVRIARLPLARNVGEVVRFVQQCLDGTYQSPIDMRAFRDWYLTPTGSRYAVALRQIIETVVDPGPRLAVTLRSGPQHSQAPTATNSIAP